MPSSCISRPVHSVSSVGKPAGRMQRCVLLGARGCAARRGDTQQRQPRGRTCLGSQGTNQRIQMPDVSAAWSQLNRMAPAYRRYVCHSGLHCGTAVTAPQPDPISPN